MTFKPLSEVITTSSPLSLQSFIEETLHTRMLRISGNESLHSLGRIGTTFRGVINPNTKVSIQHYNNHTQTRVIIYNLNTSSGYIYVSDLEIAVMPSSNSKEGMYLQIEKEQEKISASQIAIQKYQHKIDIMVDLEIDEINDKQILAYKIVSVIAPRGRITLDKVNKVVDLLP
jgi:hypothetical protein